MKLEKESLGILREALDRMEEGFAELPDVEVQYDADALRGVLLEVADRMKDASWAYALVCVVEWA